MGIVVEYANQKGEPRWVTPKDYKWDYTLFGGHGGAGALPDETIEMLVVKQNALTTASIAGR